MPGRATLVSCCENDTLLRELTLLLCCFCCARVLRRPPPTTNLICHQRYEDFSTPGAQLKSPADVPQFPLHVLCPMFWLLFSIHAVIEGGELPCSAGTQSSSRD
jgi:hypothetical protein